MLNCISGELRFTNNEDIHLEYTYANVDKQIDLQEEKVKPTESTRLELRQPHSIADTGVHNN